MQQQISNLESQQLPEDEKKTKKMTLQNELVQLQTEYAQALQEQNSSSSSGTSNGNTASTAYGGAG